MSQVSDFARRTAPRTSLVALLATTVVAQVACGGGSQSGRPASPADARPAAYTSESRAHPRAAEGRGAYAGTPSLESPLASRAPRGWSSPTPPPSPAVAASPSSPPASHAARGTAMKSGSSSERSAPFPPPPPRKPAPAEPGAKRDVTVTGTVTVTVPAPPTIPTVPPYHEQEALGGVLTAAIWDDNQQRAPFLSFLDSYPSFRSTWGIDVARRVTIRVEDAGGVAVGDAPIAIRTPTGVVNLRTHGDGTAFFYPASSSIPSRGSQGSQGWPGNGQDGQDQAQGGYGVAAQFGGLRTETELPAPSSDATWTVRLAGTPTRAPLPALDVAFVVDCTGSMGDEIAYLQAELAGVVKRVKAEHSMRRVRLGLVLYRDRGDEFVTRTYPFTEDLSTFLDELRTARAEGGGDMPESVNAALSDTVHRLSWAGDETGRLAILVADAPPHYYADEQYTYKNAIVDLAARGIKLVSVGASGMDKSTEYVFRSMSAFTGGRYVFLTDDSGVGDSHLTPDISGYQVEHLSHILTRVIGDEARSFRR